MFILVSLPLPGDVKPSSGIRAINTLILARWESALNCSSHIHGSESIKYTHQRDTHTRIIFSNSNAALVFLPFLHKVFYAYCKEIFILMSELIYNIFLTSSFSKPWEPHASLWVDQISGNQMEPSLDCRL